MRWLVLQGMGDESKNRMIHHPHHLRIGCLPGCCALIESPRHKASRIDRLGCPSPRLPTNSHPHDRMCALAGDHHHRLRFRRTNRQSRTVLNASTPPLAVLPPSKADERTAMPSCNQSKLQ